MENTPQFWILRIGDGENFKNSSKYNIWGVNSNNNNVKSFIKQIKKNDILCFVKSKSNGLIIAMATFNKFEKRIIGPIIDITQTNIELGWSGNDSDWDTEVHYTNLYNVELLELKTNIQGPNIVRRYTIYNCVIDIPNEYTNIVKYSKVTKTL